MPYRLCAVLLEARGLIGAQMVGAETAQVRWSRTRRGAGSGSNATRKLGGRPAGVNASNGVFTWPALAENGPFGEASVPVGASAAEGLNGGAGPVARDPAR